MTKTKRENFKKWGVNLLKFTAPALAIFFYQLSQNVNFREASLVGLFALYGLVADWLKKMK